MGGKVIVICGPTASGKTALAIEIALLCSGEIVSADSMQVYKYLNIGTAKPTEAECARVKHHMIDFLDPRDTFSVSDYSQKAYECVKDIQNRGKTPIICGGTGLYINALIKGNKFLEKRAQSDIYTELLKQYDVLGGEYMHNMLKQVDEQSAKKLHFNDKKRIIRALEVYRQTGATISEHNIATKKEPSRLDSVTIAICPSPREFLYERINNRVDAMMDMGLLKETESLVQSGMLVGTAAQAIGYKEILMYINGDASLERAVEILKQKSRNYAKRQLTWFKAVPNVNWISYEKDYNFDEILLASTKILTANDVKL